MLEKIKKLGAESLIYGVMTVVGRFLTFLLVPFYTNVLEPGEYGIVAYLFSLIAFCTIFFSYGMEPAYLRYAALKEVGTEQQNFSTPFYSLLITSLGLSVLLSLFSSSIASFVVLGEYGSKLVLYSAWILFFDTAALLPFASLRLQHRASLFAVIKLINIVVNVSLNVYFLAVIGMGIEGIFLANLIASVLTLIVLLSIFYKWLVPNISLGLWNHLIKFGIPYVPAGVASIALQVVDRPILRALTDDATVGIYQANYRLGIVMMLLVQTFDYAYRPFFLNMAKDPEAKNLYARIATYFCLLMVGVWIVVTVFIRDIVAISIAGFHIIHPSYWEGLIIVPIVMLAYMFTGWSSLVQPGIFIEKKTQYLPIVTGVAAFINVVVNIVLIPLYGIVGAALATLASYVILAFGMYTVSQRFFPINYELKRLLLVISLFIALGGVVFYYAVLVQHFPGIWIQLLLISGFPIILILFGFLNKEEILFLRRVFRKFDN